MNLTKEMLVDLEEKFQKVRRLIDGSMFDPETAPYTSKYAARQHLESMHTLLDNVKKLSSANESMCNKLIGMLGAVQLQLGTIALETEETSLSERHYNECMQIIESHVMSSEVASVAMNLYNQLGILWSMRSFEKGIEYLTKAEALYKALIKEKIVPIDYMDYFNTEYVSNDKEAHVKLEKAYTMTLFYLAQAYAQKNPLKSAVYCHQTLQRQYDSNDYEHIDWALNTATLSQFFMERNGFKQAKHHLCASLFMFDLYKKHLDTCGSEGEEYEAKLENYRHRLADVSRCWIKYGINLLANSKERLLATDNIETTMSACTDLAEMDLSEFSITKEEMSQTIFKAIDLSEYEDKVGHNFLLIMDDAREVFLFAQKFVNSAVEYHTLNTHASDYVEIMQDHSMLYDALSFFAEDPQVRCKLLKRSSDILEGLQNAVNPQYYMRYCRQNWYRLGVASSDMLDLKLEPIKEGNMRVTPHAMAKVNKLVDKAVDNFTQFIDSFKNAQGELPAKIPDGEEKFFLQAYFHIAAIQSRYCTTDKAILTERIKKGIEAYKALNAYCKANPNAGDTMKEELQISETMVSLLQLKIARINNIAPPAL